MANNKKGERNMLSNRLYDVLKWVAIIALPALAVFVTTVFPIWNIPYAEPISTTIMAVDVLLGALLGVSTAKYNSKED